MIYYLESHHKGGKVRSHWGPTRSSACWGLFEDSYEEDTVTFRMAIGSSDHFRAQQELFASSPWFKRLTYGSGFKILGYDTADHFTRATNRDFRDVGWRVNNWMVIEFKGTASAGRIITACRLLTQARHMGTAQERLPEKVQPYVPLILSIMNAHNSASSDGWVTLFPVTLEDALECVRVQEKRRDEDQDWEDNEWYDDVDQEMDVHQTHESVLRILKRTRAEFNALEVQSGPIRAGYMKDEARWEDELPGVLSVGAAIMERPLPGETRVTTQAALVAYLNDNL